MLHRLKNLLLDAIFPQFCVNCGKEGNIICYDCLFIIEINPYQYCPFCAIPKRVFKKGKCSSHKGMRLNGIFSATSYKNELIKKLITSFKYKPFLKTLAQPLTFLIVAHFLLSENHILQEKKENSFFVPIPLYGWRKRYRGFNQSALIAKELSVFFKIPLQLDNLIKIKKTQPQVGLEKIKREKNVKNAFMIKNAQKIKKKVILLVDDVYTTGSTMEECARILKLAGAKEVWGIVVAREPLRN